MRKSYWILVLLIGIVGLVGCNQSPAPASPPETTEITEVEEATEEPITEEATAEVESESTSEAEATTEAVSTEEAPSEEGTIEIVTVVKIAGINWFNRMAEGVEAFGEAHEGVETSLTGPNQADAFLQVEIIEGLIAAEVEAITVVPMSPEILDPILQEAMEQGIVVVSHEASNQENVHYDIEAFDNQSYGIHLMDALAERMGEEGEYAVFVGSLTSKSHNEWVDAAIAHQEENYPNMTLVAEKLETYDDPQNAYAAAKELLRTHPEIKGFQGSGSTDVAGIGQAIGEAGLEEETVVIGTSLVSISEEFLETGAVDMISFWDPADAGRAMNQIALMVLNGEMPEEGLDLGIPGYENLTSPDGKVFYGQAWIDVTQENLEDYDF